MQKTLKNNRGRLLLEKDIEAYGKRGCEKLGWTSEKFSSPQKRSVPDQIIFCPANRYHRYGFHFFIEYKRPGKIATPLQQADHAKRRERGELVFVCDCYEQTDKALLIAKYAYLDGPTPIYIPADLMV